MADPYAGLAVLTLARHGDTRERNVWPDVASSLSNYEIFWRELIVRVSESSKRW
jgi:hypothetical protein